MEQTTDTPIEEQPQPHERRRLARSVDERKIAGVASGIADYFAVSPWLVRAVFIALAFAHGLGGLLYIAGIVLLPLETDAPGTSVGERFARGDFRRDHRIERGPLPWILLIGAIAIFSGGFGGGWGNHGWSFGWAILLLVAGVFLLSDIPEERHRHKAATVEASPETADPTAVTTPAYGRRTRHRDQRVHVRRERSPLPMMTIGLAFAAFGIAVSLAQSSTVHLHFQQVLAVPMIVLGAGILVGAFVGRARGLIVPAILLLPFLVGSSIADVPFSADTGDKSYRPIAISEVRNDYAFGAGRMVVDLSQVHPDANMHLVNVHAGAGLVVVIVPKNTPVDIDAESGAGVASAMGQRDDGTYAKVRTVAVGSGDGMHLKVRVGFGKVIVTDNPDIKEARQ